MCLIEIYLEIHDHSVNVSCCILQFWRTRSCISHNMESFTQFYYTHFCVRLMFIEADEKSVWFSERKNTLLKETAVSHFSLLSKKKFHFEHFLDRLFHYLSLSLLIMYNAHEQHWSIIISANKKWFHFYCWVCLLFVNEYLKWNNMEIFIQYQTGNKNHIFSSIGSEQSGIFGFGKNIKDQNLNEPEIIGANFRFHCGIPFWLHTHCALNQKVNPTKDYMHLVESSSILLLTLFNFQSSQQNAVTMKHEESYCLE